MERGFYINGNNEITFCGNRKPVDPAGATWVEGFEAEWPEKLIENNNYTTLFVNGAVVSRTPTAEEIIEEQRADLKSQRDSALMAMVHDFGDGRVVQTRPQDEQNFKIAIENNVDRYWLTVDNSLSWFTVAELQTAYESGKLQATDQWDTFIADLKILLGV